MQRTQDSQIIFKKKNTFRKLIFHDFKIHYMATVINKMYYKPKIYIQIK